MDCHQPYDLIGYAKEHLAAPEREATRGHLASCADCRRELVALERVLGFVRAVPDIAPSPDFVARVMTALPAAASARSLRRPTVPAWVAILRSLQERLQVFPVWAISVSAHVVLFAVLTILFFRYREPGEDRLAGLKPADQHMAPSSGAGSSGAKVGPVSAPNEHFDPAQTQDPRPRTLRDPLLRVDDPILALVPLRTDPERRKQAMATYGVGPVSAAVDSGLAWLASRQRPDGLWDSVAEGGKPEFSIGLTGLSTLAFLANGHTHLWGPYRLPVERGLNALIEAQRHDGLIGPDSGNYMYNHGIATLALLEALLLTEQEHLRMPAEAAVLFIIHAQGVEGGWGYTLRAEQCDTSVSGWQMLALRLARAAGIRGAGVALQNATGWIARVTNDKGHVGYQVRDHFPNGPQALTAIGMLCRELGGFKPGHEVNQAQAAYLLALRPGAREPAKTVAAGETDFYLWHFATLALFQHDGEAWRQWNAALSPVLLAAQVRDGAETGSWPSTDRWGVHGGRIYTTSMGVLTLSTAWRYPRVYGE